MLVIIAVALQVLPNYAGVKPIVTSDVKACARAHKELSEYQGIANGIVIRKEVDRVGGYIEFEDSSRIRNEIDLAVRPILDDLRSLAFTVSAEECNEMKDVGKKRVNAVMRAVFR